MCALHIIKILPGIVKKHHDLTDWDLHEVDLEIAREIEMIGLEGKELQDFIRDERMAYREKQRAV